MSAPPPPPPPSSPSSSSSSSSSSAAMSTARPPSPSPSFSSSSSSSSSSFFCFFLLLLLAHAPTSVSPMATFSSSSSSSINFSNLSRLRDLTVAYAYVSESTISKMASECSAVRNLSLMQLQNVKRMHLQSRSVHSITVAQYELDDLVIEDSPALTQLFLKVKIGNSTPPEGVGACVQGREAWPPKCIKQEAMPSVRTRFERVRKTGSIETVAGKGTDLGRQLVEVLEECRVDGSWPTCSCCLQATCSSSTVRSAAAPGGRRPTCSCCLQAKSFQRDTGGSMREEEKEEEEEEGGGGGGGEEEEGGGLGGACECWAGLASARSGVQEEEEKEEKEGGGEEDDADMWARPFQSAIFC